MINLDNDHLMMIEPETVSVIPIQDVWTRRAHGLMFQLTKGTQWMGLHVCACGATSESFDLITPQGRVTNSLLQHYVECHRAEVPEGELIKLYAETMNWDLGKARTYFEEER